MKLHLFSLTVHHVCRLRPPFCPNLPRRRSHLHLHRLICRHLRPQPSRKKECIIRILQQRRNHHSQKLQFSTWKESFSFYDYLHLSQRDHSWLPDE